MYFGWIGSSASMREKQKSELEQLFLCKTQLHPVRQYKGSRQKMNRKGGSQTSRISSNLRIWQSYSRVPQILKVLCVWYTWKYVARLGFEPLKFLYSEFLYNTQVVFMYIPTYGHVHPLLRKKVTACYHHGQRGDHQRCPSYRSFGFPTMVHHTLTSGDVSLQLW